MDQWIKMLSKVYRNLILYFHQKLNVGFRIHGNFTEHSYHGKQELTRPRLSFNKYAFWTLAHCSQIKLLSSSVQKPKCLKSSSLQTSVYQSLLCHLLHQNQQNSQKPHLPSFQLSYHSVLTCMVQRLPYNDAWLMLRNWSKSCRK